MQPAIRVENLSKCYKIDHAVKGRANYRTLKETLGDALAAPFKRLAGVGNGEGATVEEFWALKDVNFEIQPGEVVGIIGRNGAGKSTLLKILSRITKPTSGNVTLHGRVGSLLEVGTGFHPELTGRENVYLNGSILGMHRYEIDREFDAIVDFSGVEKFLDTPVKRYSSGMYVRLAFAVAAHLNPEILIVDEVLAVGDAQFQKKCLGKLKDVADRGRTVLFVSHNIAVLRNLCERACWLETGHVRLSGRAVEITEAYLKENFAVSSRILELSKVHRSNNLARSLRIDRLVWESDPPLVHHATLSVSVHFTVLADTEEVSIGVGFSAPDGTRLLTYETDLFGDRRSLHRGQSGAVRVEIENLPLAPGYYAVDVGARSGDLFGLDYLPFCAQIEVIPGRRTPGNLVVAGAGVRIASNWQWEWGSE
jgi:lipopolysaccharide transport system ATP-binding protein